MWVQPHMFGLVFNAHIEPLMHDIVRHRRCGWINDVYKMGEIQQVFLWAHIQPFLLWYSF